MIPEYNQKSLQIGIPGLLLQIAGALVPRVLYGGGGVAAQMPEWVAWGALVGELAGSVLLIIGFSYYAKAKGYSGVLGLLGLLSCIGLLILALLPDKTKNQGG
jgi:hypothetical protein